MNILVLFFMEMTPIALLFLVGLLAFGFILTSGLNIVGKLQGYDWDWDLTLSGLALPLTVVTGLWVAGLVVCALLALFGVTI